MRLSRAPHLYALPEPAAITWPELVSALTEPIYFPREAKEGTPGVEFSEGRIPLLFPAEFDGKGKRPQNVLRVWIGGLDLDSLTREQIEAIMARTSHIRAVWLTTWSHGIKDGYRMRVFFALSRPIEPQEWSAWWPRFTAIITGGLADEQCKDPCRGFFVGYPEGSSPWSHVVDGTPLDVDAVLGSARPVRTVDTIQRKPVSVASLRKWCTILKRRKDLAGQIAHEALACMLDLSAFAEEGERDKTLFTLAREFAKAFPTGDPVKLLEHARASFEAAQSEPSQFARKVERAQLKELEQEQEQEQEQDEITSSAIREAFDRTDQAGRTHPYTPDEIDAFARRNRSDRAALRHQWIVQVDSRYWIGLAGSYQGPYTKDGFASAGLRMLAPAYTHGVEITKVLQSGEVQFKQPRDLMLDHGTIADALAFDLERPSRYDPRSRTLHIRAAQRRALEPRYWPIVDQWIGYLAGRQSDTLRDWLALATVNDRALAMLLLTGPKGVGKSLLAQGISRLWTTKGPTDMKTAFSRFNTPITQVPVVLGDEMIPVDYRGAPRTQELREMISAGYHTTEPKFMPEAKLRGYLRLIVTANSLDVLRVSGNLGKDDIDAIADRIFHVQCGVDTAAWLKTQKLASDARAFFDVNSPDMGPGDAIAEHALWLASQTELDKTLRFGVEDSISQQSVYAALTTRNDSQSAVLSWLVSFLEDPFAFFGHGMVQNKNRDLIHVDNGQLFVNPSALAGENWGLYCKHLRAPDAGKLARALSHISHKGIKRGRVGGSRRQYRQIDLERLEAWAERTGYSTAESLRELIDMIQKGVDPTKTAG